MAIFCGNKTTQDTIESPQKGQNSPQDAEKQEQTEQLKEEVPPRDISGWKWYLAIVAICSSTFLFALDGTIVADIQPVIIADLGHVEKLSWLGVAYQLSASATNLFWGKVYAQFNSKWFYIISVILFEIGSVICGAAPNINALIIGRAICGIGGAGMYVGVMTLIAATTTISERPMYVSVTGFTWGGGIVLGPVIGGAFSQSRVGWRWAFYINLFIGAAFAPIYLSLIPNKHPRRGAPLKERAKEMDWVGAILQAGAWITFILAINWGGLTYPWNSGPIIALFVVSGVLFIVLGIQQVWTIFTTVSRRIIPVEFFSSRTILILFSATAASGACSFIPIYFVALFFQFTREDTALDAGIRLLPFIVVMIFGVFANGALLSKTGYHMPWYTLGGGLALAGAALMYTVDLSTSESRIYGYTAILGAGVGTFLQASFSVAQAVVQLDQIASAVGFITLAQFLGITIALAAGNAVFLNESQERITRILPDVPLEQIQLAMQGAGSNFVQNLEPNLKVQVLEAIVESIGKTYILVVAGGALVVVLSLLMKRERLFISGGTVVA
ncbi:major facilitator superfamily domain-containing protein [Hypoxylon trugodes]|uniref:major facilitator superfamily domain-containing protein n=1 Tax=Hypoxylon trugodes TaxID=326681 RepID=UPI00218DAB48|nr:major facilitator superfamily domain-containing protein [Hypoxylon trugodes]KAI1386452.1 major facilitator superfamily domain-containing protein [Hypoxylon trugodes]